MLSINFKKLMMLVVAVFVLSTVVYTVSSILCANEAQAQFGPGNYAGMVQPGLPNGAAGAGKSTTTNNTSTGNTPKAQGAIFAALQSAGAEIFVGLREIIFVVSGFGIIAVAIGGFFGNLNWKWLAAIGIGLFVISTTSAVISYMVGEPPGGFSDVQGRVANGG